VWKIKHLTAFDRFPAFWPGLDPRSYLPAGCLGWQPGRTRLEDGLNCGLWHSNCPAFYARFACPSDPEAVRLAVRSGLAGLAVGWLAAQGSGFDARIVCNLHYIMGIIGPDWIQWLCGPVLTVPAAYRYILRSGWLAGWAGCPSGPDPVPPYQEGPAGCFAPHPNPASFG